MKKLQFTTDIHAPAQKVYETMLGLTDINTYKYWTAAFNPTSSYEGSWDKGSTIHFVGIDENGKKGGMVSRIIENESAQFVSIEHYGILDGETEITTGEVVEQWVGGHENYSFTEHDGITKLVVEIDTVEAYEEYFNESYPLALDKLKELCE